MEQNTINAIFEMYDNGASVSEIAERFELYPSEVRAVLWTEDEDDQFLTDAEADADALASAGWGTDEDYGFADEVL